ncbi:MAG: hypothetical protein Q8K72_02085 [Acidimicrobiales bacterium]|nr:hypothetical protein [Acidimicrobiales bacterium]
MGRVGNGDGPDDHKQLIDDEQHEYLDDEHLDDQHLDHVDHAGEPLRDPAVHRRPTGGHALWLGRQRAPRVLRVLLA